MAALQSGIALMAFVSLLPYFLWSHQKPAYAVATAIIVVACAGSFRALQLTRDRVLLAAGFALFLVYLSLLPKVGGGTTRWFLLIPFTVALVHLRREDLQAAFDKFHWIFTLSLVPGMLMWIWLLSGFPVEMRFTTPPGDIVQRGVTEYLEWPGTVFMMANVQILPHGGTLFRLCGVYDEPGTVGTIAALCLAATRFRVDARNAITFAAGLMSFSIAFAVLVTLGLLATAWSARRPRLLAAGALAAAAGAVPLIGLEFEAPAASNITIYTSPAAAAAVEKGAAPVAPKGTAPSVDPQLGSREVFAPYPKWRLRNSGVFDNRAMPRMRNLLTEYAESAWPVLLFGIASDASTTRGWGSSVWYRILTDFGAVGFAWLLVLYAYPLFHAWRGGRLDAPLMIFCALFLMSFYQRPIIWLPAQLLIYLAGSYAVPEPGASDRGARFAAPEPFGKPR